MESLIDDLKDGTKLLALLEVLSGMKLPTEKGRVLRRPHFLSNCNTALEFLRSKKVDLKIVFFKNNTSKVKLLLKRSKIDIACNFLQ
jgi:hypothetical protein